jgi:translation initiation factor 2B subunit (eIF-2B alpha/beta/delta family)
MFEIIVKDLKTVYGADSVARWALIAFSHKKKELDATCEFATTYLTHLNAARKTLELTRPEPVLKNIFSQLFTDLPKSNVPVLKKEMGRRILDMQKYLDISTEKIAAIGAAKVKNNSIIFTHGYSSIVEQILRKARAYDRSFDVFITETKPLSHGKIVAESLAKFGISVSYFLDVSMSAAIARSSSVILGCIAVDKKGCYHRSGALMAAQLAKYHKKPVYICAEKLKKTDAIILQKLSESDVWKPPKGVHLYIEAFECIPHDLITGIICEDGILKPKEYLR